MAGNGRNGDGFPLKGLLTGMKVTFKAMLKIHIMVLKCISIMSF